MAIQLKIQLETGLTTSMRFVQSMSASEVLKEIKDKTEVGGEGHGLMQPEDISINRFARWLRPDKTLQYYDLKTGDILLYKKKHRKLKIRLVDGATKTTLVDDSQPVAKLVLQIGNNMDLRNPEEFSLGIEMGPEKKKKRKKAKKQRVKWLNPTKSLPEQGVKNADVLLWKKKFYVDDDNVDKSNAVQLHLIYVQSCNSIVEGEHPLTRAEACMLAALQCQVEFGDFNPRCHNEKFFKSKGSHILPPSHKASKIWKDIECEWRKHFKTCEINAKYRYVQLVRGLRTYGTTYFRVQYKPKGKKSPSAVLLGVNKEGVLLVEPGSRKVLKQHPLEHLKRYAAGPNSFTLDFGEYEDEYVACATEEGEDISHLISGYIDIILKIRINGGTVLTDDTGERVVLEHVGTLQGVAQQSFTTTTIVGAGAVGKGKLATLGGGGAVAGVLPGLPGGIITADNLEDAMKALGSYAAELRKPMPLGQAGDLDPSQIRRKVTKFNSELACSAAAFIKEATKAGTKRECLDPFASEMNVNLANLISSARLAAAASGGDLSLLDGAKEVAGALKLLMVAAGDVTDNPRIVSKAELARAFAELQSASIALRAICESQLADGPSKNLLIGSARALEAATEGLLQTSKDVGENAPSSVKKEREEAAFRVQTQVNKVAATSTIVAPVIVDPRAQDYLLEGAKALTQRCSALISATTVGVMDPRQRGELATAAKAVSEAIEQLINSTQCAASIEHALKEEMVKRATAISDAVAKLLSAEGESVAIVLATKQLVVTAKEAADATPHALEKNRLLQSCQTVTSAAARTHDLAKLASSNSDNNKEMQCKLRDAAEALANCVSDMLGTMTTKEAAVNNLRGISKQLAGAASVLVAECRQMSTVMDKETRAALEIPIASSVAHTSELIIALKESRTNCGSGIHQGNFLACARASSVPFAGLVAAVRATIPKVSGVMQKKALRARVADVSALLGRLVEALDSIKQAEGCIQIDAALEEFAAVSGRLDYHIVQAKDAPLERHETQNRAGALSLLSMATEKLKASTKDVAKKALDSPVAAGHAATICVSTLEEVLGTASVIASLTGSTPARQMEILNAAKEVSMGVERVLVTGKALSSRPKKEEEGGEGEEGKLTRAMVSVVQETHTAIDALLNTAVSAGTGGRECDAAICSICEQASSMLTGFGPYGGDVQEIVEELQEMLEALESACFQVVHAARNNVKALGPCASLVASAMTPILSSANEAAVSVQNDEASSRRILNSSRRLCTDAVNLLEQAKALAIFPDEAKETKQSLSNNYNAVKKGIVNLVNSIDSAIPGKEEILEALEILFEARSSLVQPTLVTSNSQYHIVQLTEAAKVLADSVGRIISAARNNPASLGAHAKKAAKAVTHIVGSAKSASSGDPVAALRIAGKRLIRDALAMAEDPSNTTAIVIGAKGAVNDASEMVKSAVKAAEEEKEISLRRELIVNVLSVAETAQQLGKLSADAVAGKPTLPRDLQDTVNQLERKMKAVTAYIPSNKDKSFVPLVDAASRIAEEAPKMLGAAKLVVGKPTDNSAQTELAVNTKRTTKAIRDLMSVAEALIYGNEECKNAVSILQRAIGDLDAAAISSTVGLLDASNVPEGATPLSCKQQLVEMSRYLATSAGVLADVAKEDPEKLGSAVDSLSETASKSAVLALDLACVLGDEEQQKATLDQAKSVMEALVKLVKDTKATAANPKDRSLLADTENSSREVAAAIAHMVGTLRGGVAALKACDEAITSMDVCVENVHKVYTGPERTYAAASSGATQHAKCIATNVSSLCLTASDDPENIEIPSVMLTDKAFALIEALQAAAAASHDSSVRLKVLNSGMEVIKACKDALNASKNLIADKGNTEAQKTLAKMQRSVTQAIAALLKSLSEGAVLERDADWAITKLQNVQADIEAAQVFAAATMGQIEVEMEGLSLDSLQKQLVQCCAALSDDLGPPADIRQTQEALGSSYKKLAAQCESCAQGVKRVAAQLGDLLGQQDLFNATKACIISLKVVIVHSKAAQMLRSADSASALKQSVLAAKGAVTQLIQVSGQTTEAAVQSIKALEKAKRHIVESLSNFQATLHPGKLGADGKHVFQGIRLLAAASGQISAAAASNKKELSRAANECARGAALILDATKGALAAASVSVSCSTKSALNTAVSLVARSAISLLDAAKTASDTLESKKKLAALSEKLADNIMRVVDFARKLPGGETECLDVRGKGEDVEAACERELLKVAKMIEDASRRLLAARPVAVQSQILDEDAINSSILDAAKAVTIATASLVDAASAAQRERIAKKCDPKTKHFYRRDPAWANGLISAAQWVGGTTSDLVAAANAFVTKEDETDEEFLIAAAKAVMATTARLMAASRAKTDPFSEMHSNLGKSSKAVASATQMLVDAAKEAARFAKRKDPHPYVSESFDDLSVAVKRRHQIEVQARIFRLQKELDEANAQRRRMHEAEYNGGSTHL